MMRRSQPHEDRREEQSRLREQQVQKSWDQNKLREFKKHKNSHVAKNRVSDGRMEEGKFRDTGRNRSYKAL